jgi:hypothetical protein
MGTVTHLRPREAPATPEDSATQFARTLVATDPEVAARITAALLRSLDAGVAAILKASTS